MMVHTPSDDLTSKLSMAPEPHGLGPRRAAWARRSDTRVRWGALAVGSVVGIASWAMLYVLGAAGMAWTQTPNTPNSSIANMVFAIYGGLAAGAALFIGSAVASRAAGATSTQAGVLHGLAMWGMANITLIGVVFALGLGLGSKVAGPAAYIVSIGAQAVSGGAGDAALNAQTWAVGPALLGMGLVMLTSLLLGIWGGICGVSRANEVC